MKSTREIIAAIASSKQRITIDAVQVDGDVVFHVSLKDCGLEKDICSNPAIRKRFFINFVGELLLRENIQKFAEILYGLDPALYKKMVCTFKHTDFGMVIDHKMSMMTFQMNLSLVQEIITEFDQTGQDKPPQPTGTIFDEFDQSKPKSDPKPSNDDQSSED